MIHHHGRLTQDSIELDYSRRADIHAKYGGQQQGGIITPSQHRLVIIVTGEADVDNRAPTTWIPVLA